MALLTCHEALITPYKIQTPLYRQQENIQTLAQIPLQFHFLFLFYTTPQPHYWAKSISTVALIIILNIVYVPFLCLTSLIHGAWF